MIAYTPMSIIQLDDSSISRLSDPRVMAMGMRCGQSQDLPMNGGLQAFVVCLETEESHPRAAMKKRWPHVIGAAGL